MLLLKMVNGTLPVVTNLSNEVIMDNDVYSGKFWAKCHYYNYEFIRVGSGEARCPKCNKYSCIPNVHEHDYFHEE